MNRRMTVGRGLVPRRDASRWAPAAARAASLLAGALLAAWAAPAAAQSLTLVAGTTYGSGTNVAAGTAQQPVVRFNLQAGATGGAVSVSAIRMTNSGTAQPVCRTCTQSPIANPSILRLLLFEDVAKNGTIDPADPLVGRAIWDPAAGKYAFPTLAISVAQGATTNFIVAASLASGATAGHTFNFSVAPADVISQVAAGGSTVTGATSPFTIAAGPLEGDATASSTAPTVSIVNPADAGVVTGPFLAQVRLYNPAGLGGSTVALSFDGGSTYRCTLLQNANYPAETNAGIWQAQVSVVTGAPAGCQVNPGGASLKARANGLATATSGLSVIAALDPSAAPRTQGDGTLLARDNASQLCADCHAIKTHSSENISNKYGAWAAGCRACHQPHSTTNVYLVSKNVTPPAVASYQPSQIVNFSTTTGDSGSSYTPSTASFANSDSSGPCQVCHTRTKNQSTSAARWRNAGSGGNADDHYTVGSAGGTQNCTGCHSHSGGFAPGESQGNTDCGSCHGNLAQPMGSTSNYHHYMNNTGVSTLASGSKYPNAAPGATTDANRRCLMCHVDHDLFRPDLNASGARAKNLRTDIAVLPTATTGFAATDFDNAQASGGLCISCHTAAQTKSYSQQDGSLQTPAVAKADYASGAHNYAANSSYGDASTFSANCSKCHVDTLSKSKQTSATKFGLHDSPVRRMTGPLGDTVVTGTATGAGQSTTALVDTSKTWTAGQFDGYAVTLYDATNGRRTAVVKSTATSTLTFLDPVSAAPVAGTTTYTIGDPSEERFCQQCHGGGAAGNDWYGVQAMTQAAKRFDQFGKFYAAGTITTTAGGAGVTGGSTTWIKASGASGVAFTNGSNLVNGTGTSFDASMVGWSIRNTGFTPVTWYSIVRVVSATQLVISPAYAEATAASAAWRIAPGDWYLRASADASGLWYRVQDVTSITALTVYPAFPAAYASSSYVLRSAPGHPLAVTAGQHRVDEINASGWNGGTARHVTCADCHAPHVARAGNHAPGAVAPGLGGPNLGAAGVAVSYPPDKSGTATFTNASATVTWTGGSFASTDVGKNITGPDTVAYLITAFTSATQVTIQPAYKGTTSTAAFTVKNPSARTGRATFTRNSATVTWVSGPAWSASDAGKTVIGPDGFNYAITAANATTLTISPNYRGETSPTTANGGAAPWTIKDPAKAATGGFTNGSATVSSATFAATDVGRYVNGPDARTYLVTAVNAGVSATISPAYQGTTATGASFTVSNLGYATMASLGSSDLQASLCLRCHSAFAYGTSQPGAGIFAYNTSGTVGTSRTQVGVAMAAGQSDVAEDFNPGQLAHHAVMGPGRNQPLDNANTNWTSSAGRKNATYLNAQNQTVTNPNAGLDNTFVDGWGKSSRVACSDCHSSNSAEDPWGPHGSANQWILKGIDVSVSVTRADGVKTFPNRCYYKGASAVADGGVPNTGDTKNFCLNCHRADVYGLVTSGGNSNGISCNNTDQTTQVNPILYGNLSRVTHPVDNNPESNSVSDGALTRFGVYCLQCHGGEGIGAIHGTNALRGPNLNGDSFRGKRFLAGATWFGHTRASTTAAVQCWTKNDLDTVNTCSQGHGGSSGRMANYNYDSGAD